MLNYVINHIYEFFGVLFSIIYVVLSIRQSIYCWFALIIAAIINGYAFLLIGLPLQSVMQIFFIVVGISGLKNWSNINNKKIYVVSRNFNFHLYVILIGSTVTIVLFKFLQSSLILNSQFLSKEPFFDALMFMYNIIPMYMTTKKILESWLYCCFISDI